MTFREWGEKIAQSKEINIANIRMRANLEGRVHDDWKVEREKITSFLKIVHDCADRPFLVRDAKELLVEMGEL